MSKRALIVGCGYTGSRLASLLLEMGLEVTGTTRDERRAARLARAGVQPLFGELTDRETERQIDHLGPHVVFYLVPPQRAAEDQLPGLLDATSRAPLEAFVYASSSSVYGDGGGDWMDETRAPQLVGNVAKLRHAAEKTIVRAQWEFQTPGRVCRLAGIYGPGRTLRAELERGEYALIRGNDSWVNRIHVDDLACGLVAAWRKGSDGRVYNLVDDAPHRAWEFAFQAADLHELRRPEWIEPEEARRRYDPEILRRKLASRRLRNRRLKEELGVNLKYPSYREGLPAAVAEERAGD